MDYEDRIASTIEKELRKDSGYIRYLISSDTEQGELHVGDGDTLRVPAYSFSEMSGIVRKEFEKRNPVRVTVSIGFRGELFVSDDKELEVYATGSLGLIEYRVRTRSKEVQHG